MAVPIYLACLHAHACIVHICLKHCLSTLVTIPDSTNHYGRYWWRLGDKLAEFD